jgi:3-mercaptopyruvate sulfurtransferase SseA
MICETNPPCLQIISPFLYLILTDFSTIGHIAGAVNVPATDVISHLDAMDVSGYEKIVIACYTGQTAAFVTSLVRMAGYSNAFSLKWGMSSWNEACAGPLNSNSKNTYATQLEETDNPKAEAGEMPLLVWLGPFSRIAPLYPSRLGSFSMFREIQRTLRLRDRICFEFD